MDSLADQEAEFAGLYYSAGALRTQLRTVIDATLLRLQDSRLGVEEAEHTRIGAIMARLSTAGDAADAELRMLVAEEAQLVRALLRAPGPKAGESGADR